MNPPPSALVAVLGDLGRSPRMLNHARCLLARGWSVTLAGFRETEIPADLAGNPALDLIAVDLPVETAGPGRSLGRWRLLARLARRKDNWGLVLVQNPPAFPILAALALRRSRPARIIIDWHNLGHALLSHAGRNAAVTATYRWLERRWARRADEHWAVSRALAAHLCRWLGVGAVAVLHDQPRRWLCDAARTDDDRLAWWRRALPEAAPPPAGSRWLVMPSSWTPDDNFNLLLDALRLVASNRMAWPEPNTIALIATGRGPRRTDFIARFPAQTRLTLHPVWLRASAYPELLARAEAGLCLHDSASGLDLPMKLADMRAAGLPALVYDYGPVLRETFAAPAHGKTFRSASELAGELAELARHPPSRLPAAAPTWESAWAAVAPPGPG